MTYKVTSLEVTVDGVKPEVLERQAEALMPRWLKNTISSALLAYVAFMPAALYLAGRYPPRSSGRLAFTTAFVIGVIPASISIFWFVFLYRNLTKAISVWIGDHRLVVFGAIWISFIVALVSHAIR